MTKLQGYVLQLERELPIRSWELKVKDRSSRGGGGEDGGLKEFGGIWFCYDKIFLIFP